MSLNFLPVSAASLAQRGTDVCLTDMIFVGCGFFGSLVYACPALEPHVAMRQHLVVGVVPMLVPICTLGLVRVRDGARCSS